MRQPPKPDPVPPPNDSFSSVTALLVDMADTTWRMFVPIVGLLLAGRYVDSQLDTKPLLMLAGSATGALIAWALIRRQLKRDTKS